MRVQNEGTGKSSWWMVNPDGGKGGKAPRRRAVSMDNSNKLIKGARGRAAKKKAALGLQAVQDSSSESLSLSSSVSKWTGSPTSRSSDELDTWTDFRSRTNSNASTVSGRLSPILANPELDEVLDDHSISPLSPMLYSSPSSLSPSTGPLGLADLALTMNLNDGLPDDLMGDLLDNISMTSSQQPSGQDVESAGASQTGSSVFTFSCSGSNSSLGVPSSGSYGPLSSIFQLSPPSSSVTSLRQSPMQTIQENHPASFSCLPSRFNHHHTLQDLLNLDTHGSHVSDVMLTHSDPLMSQASASVSLSQNSRRNALMLRKDPMVSANREASASPNSQTSSAAGWRAQAGLSKPSGDVLCSSKDLDQQAEQLLKQLPSSSQNSSMQLAGSAANKGSSGSPLQLTAQNRFPIPPIPADLDLDVFNSSVDCDISELMDADSLDFSFDSVSLLSAPQNANKISTAVGFASSKKTSSQSWVPS
ncbi:hypothetical protein UPYG_G00232440 [Umbra pygmaea]|uniref:Uncharacterized protein n=1 Tax=Umbra pygmaea TaxID=75934 RepID=A0ABD0WIQ9_UMBPY